MYAYKTSEMIPNFAFALQNSVAVAIEDRMPDLLGDFPPLGQFDFQIGSDSALSIVVMKFRNSGIPTGGEMPNDEFKRLSALVADRRSYDALKKAPELSDKFGWDRFLIALEVVDGAVDWHLAQTQLGDWLNDEPLERANRHNVTRVKSAIPVPLQYSLTRVQAAMWVLECEDTIVQGTAFDLNPHGVVTNHHVVHGTTAMIAFRAADPTKKYAVRVLKVNAAVDLAILEIVGGPRPAPLNVDASVLAHMSHVAVCGFPNFRLGDSGVLTPGFVIGSRPVSGIQRFLTNAPIVAGMSGGPTLGAAGDVVGVCVTGSLNFGEAGTTEDHCFIPVAALDILGA